MYLKFFCLSTAQAHLDEDKQFVLLDDENDDTGDEEGDVVLDEDGESEVDDRDIAGYDSLFYQSFYFLSCKSANPKSHLSDSVWKMLTSMRRKMPVRLWVKSHLTLGESCFTYYTGAHAFAFISLCFTADLRNAPLYLQSSKDVTLNRYS